MTAETRLLHYGRTAVFTADDRFVVTGGLKIFGVVARKGWQVRWAIFSVPLLRGPFADGTAWTTWGAWGRATAAAHRPGIGKEAAR